MHFQPGEGLFIDEIIRENIPLDAGPVQISMVDQFVFLSKASLAFFVAESTLELGLGAWGSKIWLIFFQQEVVRTKNIGLPVRIWL